MAFWSKLFRGDGPREDLPVAENPGDPAGVEVVGEETFSRGLPSIAPTPWDGWPADWSTAFQSSESGLRKLIDTAWACIDLNSNVLATMPLYRLRGDQVVDPKPWMINPDPMIYNSRIEFLKQLFWDFQSSGETFILSMREDSDKLPVRMRVIPPWLVNAELVGGKRRYSLGPEDVTNQMLHIRYHSSIDNAHGYGPLDAAGARMTTAGLLQRYARKLAETGGIPHYWLGIERWLNPAEAEELLNVWIESRKRHAGDPAVASGGATLNSMQSMSAKDMALLELAQFSESRIAILLGVPPFLVGLPSGGDSMTYSNVSQLFDFHDRSSLRPKATTVMTDLSEWALRDGESVELNRDEYSRPDFASRMTAYKTLMDIAQATGDPEKVTEVWAWIALTERFHGPRAAAALSGNNQAATQPDEIGNGGRIGYGNGYQ